MKKVFLLFLLPLFSWGQVASYLEDTVKLNYSNSITVKDLKKHIQILASDSLEGRETGEQGAKKAAEYIANCFKKVGIPPYKCKTYYQKFKVKSKGHLRQRIVLKQKYVKGENVLGFIEGTDLKDEVLIITAHYDHLGKKNLQFITEQMIMLQEHLQF